MHPLLDFLADPGASAVLTDFDGTLSHIADEPSAARPVDGAVDLLGQLADRLELVAVVSGRSVDFLSEWITDPRIQLSGLYGLEARVDGERLEAEGMDRWRAAVEEGATFARGELTGDGVVVEAKGLSLTIHFRRAPEREEEVRDVARQVAARTELRIRPAKASIELHPPVDADKGTAIEALVADRPLRRVAYLGDDVGDLPAFDALDRLAELGVGVLRLVVRSGELAPEVAARADVLIDGPEAAVELLSLLTE